MRKIKFIENQVYHIYNRGVEKRKIFLDKDDYFRFIHDLFEFNDEESASLLYYKKPFLQSYEAKPHRNRRKRSLLVEILVFVLMPNHFHLLLRQLKDNGITKFMHKLGTGYTMYFNEKCGRVGSLFQGTYKALLVEKDSHFLHLPYYIHSNPLELRFPKWKEKEIKDYKKAMKFLENYRWSSFQDYIGKKNFPSVTQRESLLDFFGGPEEYKKDTIEWLKEMDLEEIKDLTHEL